METHKNFIAVASQTDMHDDAMKKLRESPHAPIFRNESGHHLTTEDLTELKQFADSYSQRSEREHNQWLEHFVKHCQQQVPFYSQYNWHNNIFSSIPCITRGELSQDVTQFVPNELPLSRLICFETSGTSGHPLTIPSHPIVAARYYIHHAQAMKWNGIEGSNLNSDIAVFLVGYQERCFTYISKVPYWRNAGLAKLNFHPNDWRDPNDRMRYLDEMSPDVISGDPVSLSELALLDFKHKPKAVLSTSMSLLSTHQQHLTNRFSCPVIDIYSLNEAGPVAATDGSGLGWRLLQSQLLIELLDENGYAVEPGERGEITLTGGFNHYLPLLRYRTGDHASLHITNQGIRYLQNLEGRPPVTYVTQSGERLNNVDVTHLLQAFALSQFQFHQYSNKALRLQVRGSVDPHPIEQRLRKRFGKQISVEIQTHVPFSDKIIQYTSDLI